MLFDVQGQLNSMNLAESKALWPLFEAVVNSIQAIEESPNKVPVKLQSLQSENHLHRNNYHKGKKGF